MKSSQEKGATTLEAVLTLVPFLFFVLGVVQICILAYTAFTVQYNVNTVLRASIINPISGARPTFSDIKTSLLKELNNFNVKSSNVTVNMCNGVVDTCTGTTEGLAGNFVTLQVKANVYSIFGNPLSVTGKAIAKKEPY